MFTLSIHRSFFSKTFLYVVVCFWALSAQAVFAEQVTSFDADIEVQSNGDFVVTETIVYDFGTASRHGIFRKVKDKHPQSASSWLKNRYLDPELLSVKRGGNIEQYTTESGYRGLSVKIGSPSRTVTGEQVYEIQYVVKGGLAVYDGQPEVYWNVTGDEWEVSMQNVTATIRAASGVTFGAEYDCYFGEVGSTERCTSNVLGPTATQFSTNNVFPGSQLTVAQQVSVQKEPVVLERWNLLLVLFGGVFIWLAFFFSKVYRWRFQYRTNESIIAHYEPYADFKPMFTGVLFDGRLDSRDITAGIVYLAEQGFLKIVQTKRNVLNKEVFFNLAIPDYEVTLLRPFSDANLYFQQDLLSLIFTGQPAIDTEDRMRGWLSMLSKESKRSAESLEVGKTVSLSDMKWNQTKLRKNASLIRVMKASAKKDLVKLGFIENGRAITGVITALIFVALFFSLPISLMISPLLTVELVIFGIGSVVIGGLGSQRRTAKGYEALRYLEGFKDFLLTTEKERYKFHNAPEKSPEQFMEFLPYAIAFGVEKEWAEVFKDIQIGTPDWYESHSGAAFNATLFARDLGSFSSNLASSGASSSGGSGSSGGGSSGGGGGGGGGGSW